LLQKCLSVDGTFDRENLFIRAHEERAVKETSVDVLKYAAYTAMSLKLFMHFVIVSPY